MDLLRLLADLSAASLDAVEKSDIIVTDEIAEVIGIVIGRVVSELSNRGLLNE
jgi:hypothetical protein